VFVREKTKSYGAITVVGYSNEIAQRNIVFGQSF